MKSGSSFKNQNEKDCAVYTFISMHTHTHRYIHIHMYISQWNPQRKVAEWEGWGNYLNV